MWRVEVLTAHVPTTTHGDAFLCTLTLNLMAQLVSAGAVKRLAFACQLHEFGRLVVLGSDTNCATAYEGLKCLAS